MLVLIKYSDVGIDRLDAVDVCYSSWVDPSDYNAKLVKADAESFVMCVEPHSFIRLNNDSNLMFGFKDGQVYHIPANTKKYGACTSIRCSAAEHYLVRVVTWLMGTGFSETKELLSEIEKEHGHLVTAKEDGFLQVVTKVPNDLNELVEGTDYIKANDCIYDFKHNVLVVGPSRVREFNCHLAFYADCHASNFQHLPVKEL